HGGQKVGANAAAVMPFLPRTRVPSPLPEVELHGREGTMRCSLVVLVAAGLVAACSAPHGDPDRCAALPLSHEALQALERRLPPEVATVLFEEHMGFRLGALLSQPPLATEEIRHFATRESVEGDP